MTRLTGTGIKYRDFVFPGKLEDLTEVVQSVFVMETGPLIIWAANQAERWDTMLVPECDLSYAGLMIRYLADEGWQYDLLEPLEPHDGPRPKPSVGDIFDFVWTDRS